LKNYYKAFECYNKAIELNPFDPLAYINKGDALYLCNKLEEAILEYDKAIEIKPTYLGSYLMKIEVMEELGRDLEANECYKQYNQVNHLKKDRHRNRNQYEPTKFDI